MAPEVGGFAPYFRSRRVKPELDELMMPCIFGLRFEVYCQECGFLSEQDYPDARESDEHDARSIHFCAVDLREELAGYLRLVPADAQGQFPFQEHCPGLFGGVTLPDAHQAGEISRLMVR